MDFILSFLEMEALIKTSERKIRKALDKAKLRSAVWCKHIPIPTVSSEGLIDAADAQPYLKQCMEAVENGLVEMAQRFSPIQWLWYLRRFPHLYFIDDFGFESYNLILATILSAKS